jgi:flagellar protein FlaG
MEISGLSISAIDPSMRLEANSKAASAAKDNPQQRTDMSRVHQAVRDLNERRALGQDTEVTFVLDRTTRRPLIRVVNRETKEVLMQLPPEYALRLADSVQKSTDSVQAG